VFVFARRSLFESRTNVFLLRKAEITVETRQNFWSAFPRLQPGGPGSGYELLAM